MYVSYMFFEITLELLNSYMNSVVEMHFEDMAGACKAPPFSLSLKVQGVCSLS